VGKLELQAAEKQAEAIQARGQAEAAVVLYDYQARAEPLARSVKAFGDGTTYAQQFFLQRVAPSIRSILTNTDGPFAEIFKELQTFRPASGERADSPSPGAGTAGPAITQRDGGSRGDAGDAMGKEADRD
jgi:hypothetical protein